MITFHDVSGRRFAIFDCDLCKNHEDGDIVSGEVADEILADYPAPHLCVDCDELVRAHAAQTIRLAKAN